MDQRRYKLLRFLVQKNLIHIYFFSREISNDGKERKQKKKKKIRRGQYPNTFLHTLALGVFEIVCESKKPTRVQVGIYFIYFFNV